MIRNKYNEIFDYLDTYFMDEHTIVKKTDYKSENCVGFTRERFAHQFVREISETKDNVFKGFYYKDFEFKVNGDKVYFQYKQN